MEEAIENPHSPHNQRLQIVFETLKSSGAKRVLDLGCGDGRLLERLLADRQFTEIVGVDISSGALEDAAHRLQLDRLPSVQRKRIHLMQSALTDYDSRLEGYDAAALVEVIEHFDPPHLAALEPVLFECAHPNLIVITTPNAEYNALFDTLDAGKFRHPDHRFEWTREEFEEWAEPLAARFGYVVRFEPIGPRHDAYGGLSQMAIFERSEELFSDSDKKSESSQQ